MEKRPKKILNKKSNQDEKWNKKMGGRSHVITFGVFPVYNGTLRAETTPHTDNKQTYNEAPLVAMFGQVW